MPGGAAAEIMRNDWEEDLRVLSAENVEFSIQTAGVASRLAAVALDSFLQFLVWALCLLAISGFNEYFNLLGALPAFWQSVAQGALGVGSFLLFFGYYFFFEWRWDGQTPGKRYFGLRVRLSNGLPLDFWSALSRNLVRVVDFLPLCYGFGALVSLSNKLNQRMGDLVAGTIVVSEGKPEKRRKPLSIGEAADAFLKATTTMAGQPLHETPLDQVPLQLEAARSFDADVLALAQRVTREDFELARDFLARRTALPLAARNRLGAQLWARIAPKAPEIEASGEELLEEIVRRLSRYYAG